ncbi:MAG TPA: hypothetical protein VIA98_03525 [Allosphingosinicella sp.]
MKRRALLLLVLAGCAGQAAAAEPPPLTWDRLSDMTPEAVAHELFGAFGDGLYLVGGQLPKRGDRFGYPLRHLSFLSQPRASYRAGVCETDWIQVELAPLPPTLEQLEPGLRPRAPKLHTNYIVQDLAKVRDGGPSVDEMPALEEACAAINPLEAPTILAETAFDITGTVGHVADLVEAAREGKTTAPLACTGDEGAMPEAECLRMLATLKPETITTAHLEAGCGRKEADVSCRTAGARYIDREIRIVFETRRRGGGKPARITVEMLPDLSGIIN